MTFEEIRELALAFPGVEEHLVFGEPTFRVGKRFLACIAKIDAEALVLKVPDPLEREFLLTEHADIYYVTPHYADFGAVLVRMPKVDKDELQALLERAWLAYAPKKLVKAWKANLTP
ncbi:MAG: MmcQ/YjbR family DNA-binding protein [Anaerolineae bacterium]|nr:MmcQ/YjbR family DNA-binding protein [Anaerolineae bacterium]